MKEKSILKEKSFLLGLKVSMICKLLKEKKKQGTFYSQFSRAGTAVGALIAEAEFAQSRADFINKLSVSLKEANETYYWLKMLNACGDLDDDLYEPLSQLLHEIISMLVVSVKTAKRNGM
jgi:four helix bundle protein